MLFYLQRSIDINTLIYEVNYNTRNEIIKESPVKTYWINYREGGKITPLNPAQKKYAYGVKTDLYDQVKQVFRLRIVSFKKRDIYVKRSDHDGLYHAYMILNGEAAVLHKIFVNIAGGTLLNPDVRSIELTGHAVGSSKEVKEIIYTR